ncbi:MAG: hypothetical protein HC866_18185 [Leptolyngbyaceae cyanobacterium RU_5_1]|nr:hypothetical protein [Leptolyngbyaceae cyanobacterium RU_5_1]
MFHTNTHDERLQQTREKYLARKDIHQYMNCGYGDEEWDFVKLGRLVKYYGLPEVEISPIKRLQIEFGASPFGVYWRSFKHKMRLKVS